MYVCLCLGVTDHSVREAIDGGACTAAEVMACTGAGTRCGSCRGTVAEMVRDAEAGSSPSVRRLTLVRRVETAA